MRTEAKMLNRNTIQHRSFTRPTQGQVDHGYGIELFNIVADPKQEAAVPFCLEVEKM